VNSFWRHCAEISANITATLSWQSSLASNCYRLCKFTGLILVTPKEKHMATIQLTAEGFKEKIFDYTKEQEWKYNGSLPAIIDFYADWCGPCKAVAPVLEDLSKEYEGKLVIYKIDTDREQELSMLFGIQSIPTLLFIPVEGSPMMQKGAIPKKAFQQVIEERLLTTDVKS
jgi:thioredoxin